MSMFACQYIIILLGLLFFFPETNCQVLRNVHDFALAAKLSDREVKARAVEKSEFVSNRIETMRDEVASRAEEALIDGLTTGATNVNSVCLNHTEMLLEAIVQKQNWALRLSEDKHEINNDQALVQSEPKSQPKHRDGKQPNVQTVVDAMGKPPSELLDYQLTWLGSYDECVAIHAQVNNTHGQLTSPFKGRYCAAAFPLGPGGQATLFSPGGPALAIGVCVPNSCGNEDTAGLVNTLVSLLPLNTSTLKSPQITCQIEDRDYDTKAIVVIVICSIFGFVMLVATLYEIWLMHQKNLSDHDGLPAYNRIEETGKIIVNGNGRTYGTTDEAVTTHSQQNGHVPKSTEAVKYSHTSNEPSTLGKMLLSFSVYTNAKKLLNVSQPAGTLTAVNGVRFVSMTWVVLGHSYAFGLSVGDNVATFLPEMLKRFSFQVISNATVCVDTFFVLSGLLVSYLSLKEMKKRRGIKRFKWGMFYFHRFWRLTPPYMLFLMVYAPLFKYISSGPMWPQQGIEYKECEGNWWHNLLYINNFIEPEKMCMAWSWYLANDMQFYVLSPLMLIPLYISPVLGTLSCLALILTSLITTGVISSSDELGPSLIVGNAGESFTDVYIKPWCRIGPYAVGFFAGYILYKTDCKLKISKILNLICWAVAAGLALSVLYGLYDSSGLPNFSNSVSALYNATNRTAWGIAIAWVIVACATGNGGWINTLLSWKGIIPLSRLTYCAYLVHPVVMETYYYSRRTLIHFTDLESIWLFCGHLCITFVGAFILSLAFESPMMGLEKVLLGRAKNS